MATANDAVYGALLGAYARAFPAGSVLELRAGESVIASVPLPDGPWKGAGRVLDSQGVWMGTAMGGGTVDNYVLRSADSSYTDAGSISGADGSGDMRMDNPALAKNQIVTITSFRKEF